MKKQAEALTDRFYRTKNYKARHEAIKNRKKNRSI